MLNKFFIIFILTGVLFGCAHQSLSPVITDAHGYQQKLAQLDHWQLQGKIAVRHANQSDSAALRWQQDAEHFDIFLSGPLGAGATRLIGTPKQFSIQNNKEETAAMSNAEQLIEKHLGWTLPLDQLPQWILGHNDNRNSQFNIDHTLAGFEQDGWRVEYQRYQIIDQWLLPEKIVLKHEDMQVTIIIKQWTLL